MLYECGGSVNISDSEDVYHWSFLIGPKNNNNGTAVGRCFHARNGIGSDCKVGWFFEEKDLLNLGTNGLIA
ncbi:hypothetical protein OG21DRAFT_1492300 [Imleria badia]|nr:hypothetical protein OG21DRAFT_1492300 [Imleria badia]